MKNLKLLLSLFVFCAFTIIACSKGSTGPKGATGPAGPDSVLHSTWITLNTTFINTDSLYEQVITASGLTADILDNGVVLSYIGVPGSGSSGTDTAVFSVSEASTLLYPVSQALFVGSIQLYSADDYTGYLYRYVLIPGSIVTNGIGGTVYTKQQLKAMTYADLQKKLAQTASTSATN